MAAAIRTVAAAATAGAAVCEPKSSAAAAVVTGAVVGVAIVKAAGVVVSLAEGITLTVFAACAVSAVILVRLLRPARRTARIPARVGVNMREIAAPSRAIEAPRVVQGEVIGVKEAVR